MKLLGRTLKILLFIIVLLIIAVLTFVVTFDANNYKTQITDQVENATGRDFSIDGDINLSIFPWVGIKIEKVSLGNEKGFSAKHFAAIEQLDVKVNVLPLLKKEVEINTIRLHGLDVSLEVAKNKSNNWSGLSQPAESGEAAAPIKDDDSAGKGEALTLQSLQVEGFEFVDALIRYQDRSTDTSATVSELNLTTNEIQFDQPVEINFAAHIVNNAPAIDTLINLSTQLTFDKTFNEFDLRDLVFTVLADANEFVPQQEKVEITSNINVLLAEQRIVLDKFQLSALGVTTKMKMTVTQFLKSPVIQGLVDVQPFNAKDVARRLAIELPEMAKADALNHLALKTNIELRGEKFQANNFSFVLDKSILSGWIHVLDISKQSLRYELAFDSINVNDYLPPVVEAVETDKDKKAPVDAATGDEKIELPLEMMRQLDVQGDFRIASLTALDYDISQFLLHTEARDGVIDLKPVSMQVLEGQVSAGVKLDARKDIPAYAIDMKVNQVQVAPVANPFLEGIMGDKPLRMEGLVNVDMNVKTGGETVNQIKKASKGKVVLDMKQTAVHGFDPEYFMRSTVADYVSSKGMDFTDTIMKNYTPRQVTVFDKIFSTVNIADGKARTDDFIMSSKRVSVGAKGHVDIMENKLDVVSSVSLPRGKTVVEKMLNDPIYVRVFGPFDALEYKLDTTKLKASTTDVLRDQAKAKLDAEKKRLKAKADAEKQRLLKQAKEEEQRLKAKAAAEEQRLKEKAKQEEQRLKAKAEEERKRAEDKARQELKDNTDSYKDKLQDKLKGIF